MGEEEGEEEQDRSPLCSKAVMIWFANPATAATSGDDDDDDDDDDDFIVVVVALATFLVVGSTLSISSLSLGMPRRRSAVGSFVLAAALRFFAWPW